MNVLYVLTDEKQAPLIEFINSLERKMKEKLIGQFSILSKPPLPREPLVKHFTIEKYSRLYELRAKNKIMVRIIFTIMDNNDILLLTPFVKKHKRNTMQALDSSLKLLAQIDKGTYSVKKLNLYL